MRKVRTFIRRWKYASSKSYIIKPKSMVWTADDGVALSQFLTSDCGIKVLTAMDDVVFNVVMDGKGDIALGMVDLRNYILGLQSPDVNNDPRLVEDNDYE